MTRQEMIEVLETVGTVEDVSLRDVRLKALGREYKFIWYINRISVLHNEMCVNFDSMHNNDTWPYPGTWLQMEDDNKTICVIKVGI